VVKNVTALTKPRNLLVITSSAEFAHGVEDGILWYFHGDTPKRPVTEDDVVDFLKGNFSTRGMGNGNLILAG